jgi:hypothetical protein
MTQIGELKTMQFGVLQTMLFVDVAFVLDSQRYHWW